jgi:hypothetical protein
MLRQTPSYQFDESFSLYVPKAMHDQQLAFHTPVRLCASLNNPGAEELAAEVQAQYAQNFQVVRVLPTKDALFLVGDRVRHGKRGLGTVSEIMPDGRTRVEFDEGESHRYRESSIHKLELVEAMPGRRRRPLKEDTNPIAAMGSSRLRTSQRAHSAAAAVSNPKAPAAAAPSSIELEPEKPTHFLLYLNKKTFIGSDGERLANEVHEARAAELPIVLVHESDGERDGCAFSRFFESTPCELIDSGLYNTLAEPFVSGKNHRKLSYKLLAKKLGAVEIIKRNSFLRLNSTILNNLMSGADEVAAAVQLQAATRGVQTRSQFRKQREEKLEAVVRLQAATRGSQTRAEGRMQRAASHGGSASARRSLYSNQIS